MKKLNLLLLSFFAILIAFGQTNKKYGIVNNTNISLKATQKGINNEISCTSGNLFSNPYENIQSALISEADLSSTLAAQFSTIGGDIETISLWGINASFDTDLGSWSVCDDTDTDFSIVFYQNNNNDIGDTAVYFESVVATKTQTDVVFQDYIVYEYTFTLPESVDENNGFISLVPNSEDESCWFLWISSSSGYGISKHYNDTAWENLDDMHFTLCLGGTESECTAPTNLLVSNFTEEGADLSWTETGTAENWIIEYGESGFTQGAGTTVTSTETSYTVSGLNPETAYQFYVKADCGNESSSFWAGPYEFFTLCDLVTTFPYNEGFEGAEDYLKCWNVLYNTAEDGGLNGSNLTVPPTSNTWSLLTPDQLNGAAITYIKSGFKSAFIGYTAPDFNWLISRRIEVPASGSYELKWWHWFKNNEVYDTKLYLVVYSNDTWNTLATFNSVSQINEYEHQMQVSLNDYLGQTIKIAFVYENNTAYQFAVDDLSVDASTTDNIITLDDLSLYPNPAKDNLNIKNGINSIVTLYNMSGDIVKSTVLTSANQQINISDLSSGTYIVKINNNNNIITSKINVIK